MPPMVQIFIAYAHEDAAFLNELRNHLSPLEQDEKAKIWYDGEINPGAEWEEAIKSHLHGSQIILLLVSADSLASEYFYKKEVTQALERHNQGEARVVPVIIRRCAWHGTRFGHLQALPKDGNPVASWKDRDDAWHNVAESVMRLVKEESLRKPSESSFQVPKAEAGQDRPKRHRGVDRDMRRAGVIIAALVIVSIILQAVFGGEVETVPPPPDHPSSPAEDTVSSTDSSQTKLLPPPVAIPSVDDSMRRAEMNKLIGEMVEVEGGKYIMGYMKPRDGRSNHALFARAVPYREVEINKFYIGQHEVTQALWRAVMGGDPPQLFNQGCGDCPVESVSWEDVQKFLNKLNKITGKKYRLPTEAEWEFAARGGKKNIDNLYSGGGRGDINSVAHYKGNTLKVSLEGRISGRPAEVGKKRANELRLYDMSGNVWEWVADCWHDNYEGAPPNGNAWLTAGGGNCAYRVIRGGCFESDEMQCQVAFRGWDSANKRDKKIGFRLAR